MKKEVMTINLNDEMPKLMQTFNSDEENEEASYETILTVYEITEDEVTNSSFSHIHESFAKNPIKLLFEYTDSSDEGSSYGPYGGGMTSLIYVGLKELNEKSIKKVFTKIFKTCDYFSI